MAINVVIEDESGGELSRWGQSLSPSALQAADDEGACLQFVDPYGDTVFNQKQIPVLVIELMNLTLDLEDAEQAAVARDLATFLKGAQDQPHVYVRFIGD
jgi:hypothetical protein